LYTISMVLAIIFICWLESSTSGGHIVEFTERADSLLMLLACAGVNLAFSLSSCIRRDVSDGYMTTWRQNGWYITGSVLIIFVITSLSSTGSPTSFNWWAIDLMTAMWFFILAQPCTSSLKMGQVNNVDY
jgi:hypothetical protein